MTNRKGTSRGALRRVQLMIVFTWIAVLCGLEAEAAPILGGTEPVRYPSQIGYPPAVDPESRKPEAETANSSKCGVKDVVEEETGGRTKRYAFAGTKWDKTDLTYNISKYSTDLDRTSIDNEIARAFAVWSEYTDLIFTPKSGDADIEITFERGEHGDGYPFDGESGEILAHADYPGGEVTIHFNDDEYWTINSHYGHNLFETAVHEIGHTLGLDHSDVALAIMYKYEILSYNPNFKLDSDDITGIQSIYGPKTKRVPDICEDPEIDTMFTSPEGDIYAFRGKYYWNLTANRIAAGYPKLIAARWEGLPDNIDLAFAHGNGTTIFVKGSKYWRYAGRRMMYGYPKKISDGIDQLPDNTGISSQTIEANRRTSSLAMKIYCLFNMVAVAS